MTAQELKNSILMRAVQGKLVPQDPNDEPASVLLAKIRAEKELMMKEGKIKKELISEIYVDPSDNQHYEKIGKTVKCIEDEIPFEIPESWEWCRLGGVGTFIRGSGIKRTETTSEGIQCVRYGELYTTYTTSFEKTVSYVNEELANKSKQIQYGDALLTLTGENKQDIGKTVVFLGNERTVIGGDLIQYTNHCFEPLFLSYLLNSPYVVYQKSIASTGDIIVHLSGVKLSNILVAFPPIKEQARIVEAIDKYLPLISKYDMYNISKSKMDSEIYPLLKKSLLQYAIQGKLVPQDPNDEPASVLLGRIRAEKEQLIKEGKIKRDKNDSYIYRGSDNSYYNSVTKKKVSVPYDIPNSWVWSTLSNVLDVRDGTHDSPKYYSTGIPLITSKNISSGQLSFDNVKYISKQDAENINLRSKVDYGDILFAMIGSIGNPVQVKSTQEFVIKNMALLKKFPAYNMNMNYIMMYLEFVQHDMKKQATGGVQAFVSLSFLRNFYIPVPPLAEQERIVVMIRKIINLF